MLFDDAYKTIENVSEGIFKDKGSKFMAFAFPIQSENEVKPILSELKIKHPKANHFCYAYRLTADPSIYRINDDGEPAGTAGRPILNVLRSADLTQILVVVVRYFGGTLLGVSGLINAYKNATVEAIKETKIITKTIMDSYEITFDYLQMNEVMKCVKDEQLTLKSQQFDLHCKIEIEIKKTAVNRVIEKLKTMDNIMFNYIKTL